MRLNEKTYPTFDLLESKKYYHIEIDAMFKEILPDVKSITTFVDSLKTVYEQVNKKYYLTNTFRDAIDLAMPKIVSDDKHYTDIPTDCGVIFTKNGFNLYLSNPTDKQLKLLVYGFTNKALTTYAYVTNDFKFGGVASTIKDGEPYNDKEHLNAYINTILATLYFIHNCEIEQKILKPKDKYRENGNKHYNESKSDLIILDCKWFTDLIRQVPFHVKGHLRWQHHGEGFKKRKLIWISDFEKNGYTRKASKNKSLINQS